MLVHLAIISLLLTIVVESIRCINGGEWIAHACTMDSQCEPYRNRPDERVACLGSECCTIPCTNNGTFTGDLCVTSYDCLPSTEKIACLTGLCCTVPQQCPYGGEVIGLECVSSESCEYLAKGAPVLCIKGTCCAYPFLNYFTFRFP